MGHIVPQHKGSKSSSAAGGPQFLETFNGNCRATLLERLRSSDSMVICAQEIGTGPDAVPDLQRAARTAGFRALCSPSRCCARGSHSAGVAIFARQHLGLRWNPTGGELVKGRLISAVVDIPGWPEFVVYSAYFHDSVGLDTANMNLLSVLGASISRSAGSFLAAADWNVEPEVIEQSGFTRKAGLITMAPARHTCIMSASASTIDFFLASQDIVRATEKVRVYSQWHGGPHKP
eukprot:9492649-Pyramimonas_sp.AAC.2